MWTPVVLVLWLKNTTFGIEDDGRVNHLLETSHTSEGKYSISFTYKELLPFEDRWVLMRVIGECSQVLDRVKICNADRLEQLR